MIPGNYCNICIVHVEVPYKTGCKLAMQLIVFVSIRTFIIWARRTISATGPYLPEHFGDFQNLHGYVYVVYISGTSSPVFFIFHFQCRSRMLDHLVMLEQ